jgi:hypothetical protein
MSPPPDPFVGIGAEAGLLLLGRWLTRCPPPPRGRARVAGRARATPQQSVEAAACEEQRVKAA